MNMAIRDALERYLSKVYCHMYIVMKIKYIIKLIKLQVHENEVGGHWRKIQQQRHKPINNKSKNYTDFEFISRWIIKISYTVVHF